jgi:hypothetical protein
VTEHASQLRDRIAHLEQHRGQLERILALAVLALAHRDHDPIVILGALEQLDREQEEARRPRVAGDALYELIRDTEPKEVRLAA